MLKFAFIAFLRSEGESGGLLNVVPGLIFWTVITFVILLLILKKIAWKPILTSLQEREKFIKDSIDKANIAQTEAEKLLAENNVNLVKAEEEAQKIISQGREYSEKLKQQNIDETKKIAQKMIDEAKAEIERKNQEAFSNLKNQIAQLAVDSVEKIIRESLDKEKQKQIVEKYLRELN